MKRRTLLKTAGLATGTLGLAGANSGWLVRPARADQPWPPTITEMDMIMGDPDAPVTIIEYASYTCGHCANFHNDTLPAIKEQYIDPGHVRLIFRDFPLDGLALRAGMIARAVPEQRFFSVVDVIFQQQTQWVQSSDPVGALANIALMAGASQDDIMANLEDEALADAIIGIRMTGESLYQVNSTPTFVIEGDVIPGNLPLDHMQSTLDRHL